MLKRRGFRHEVLNAKYHQREAEIVAQAGQPGAITIATNMAGRGTDIKLGPGVKKCQVCGITAHEAPFGQQIERPDLPAEEIKRLGCNDDPPCGLVIIGTERHEARRIDRQLRGRAGRQGDPGQSVFFLSLEDDLMRLFGSDRIARIMDRTCPMAAVTHGWVMTSFSSEPVRSMMRAMRSDPNNRIRSSSSDRKNTLWPGSPWRPARPRSCRSMRRASCRSVPMMTRPHGGSSLQPSRLISSAGRSGRSICWPKGASCAVIPHT